MSDDVRNAALIGASINKGLGSIRIPKPKNPKDKDTKDKGPKKVKSTRTNAPKKEKEDKNIIDAEIVEPTFVKSERINTPKEVTFNRQTLPTHGPGSEYNPNRGRQFNG
jgi:CRISPR/Cas system CMR-associated protein Cmr1 (group 7 of RAMP superfamily)